MGFSHSFIAVNGCGLAAVIDLLDVEAGAETDFSRRFGVVELPGGWVVVVRNDSEAAFKQPLVRLAELGPAVACGVEDHVMISEARGYEGGREVWRVVRDSSEEPYCRVDATGNPPPQFASIRDAAFAAQKADDEDEAEDIRADFVFEVPPDLAMSMCGFKFGEYLPEGIRFRELRPRRKSLFQRVFGRR